MDFVKMGNERREYAQKSIEKKQKFVQTYSVTYAIIIHVTPQYNI